MSYVQSAVGEYRLKRWGHKVQELIKAKLINGANGMFRWVACQVEELRKCPNQRMLLQSLECLPKDLETTYDQILQRIDESTIEDRGLATVSTFDSSEGTYDPYLALAHPDDVIQVCSSLVTKTDDKTVQLAHASVKEYFLRKPRMWRDE
ncbi:hypothetical protein F5887DRAFT_1084004 [Amanita rubescens]|nr:hypothetical protein F5887DRAFT_1084004 [Amanita rubescens]